jgi:enoyl-CoA hydratase
MAATSDILLVERRDGVAVVTLNRPEALNALSTALVRRIAETFRELAQDAEVGAAILTGAGRAFSAGVDLKELAAAQPGSGDRGASDAMPAAIAAFDRPLIGAVNGFAITGGFELALMCDLLIAAPEAKFADTHARIGVVPGWGMSQRLARWIGPGRAKELSFTGNYLSAQQAEAWGLVNRVVPLPELIPSCLALARDMLSCDPQVVREVKRLIDVGQAGTLAEGLRAEDAASRAHMKRMASGEIAARRTALQQRGRDQSGSASRGG